MGGRPSHALVRPVEHAEGEREQPGGHPVHGHLIVGAEVDALGRDEPEHLVRGAERRSQEGPIADEAPEVADVVERDPVRDRQRGVDPQPGLERVMTLG